MIKISIPVDKTLKTLKYNGTIIPIANKLQTKTVNPSTSQQTISPDSDYDGLSEVTVNAMPIGTEGIPVATKSQSGGNGVSYSIVPDTLTWEHNSYVTIGLDIDDDGVLTAYKASGGGTANNMKVCYPQSDTFNAGSVITSIQIPQSEGTFSLPITVWWDNQNGENQDHNNHTISYTVVASGTPTTSITVTPTVVNTEGYIAGGTKTGTPVTVTASEVVSGSEIKTENGTYDVTNLASLVVNCPTGSGIQYSASMGKATNKTSYTAVGGTIEVQETGNYKCSWVAFAYAAGSSSTYATQLYMGSTAVGSVHNAAAYSASSGFVAVENSIALTAGQTIGVRARTRSGTSYWTVAGMLVIEKI